MIKRFLLYGIPKSLLFKILIGLLILLIGKNVFALEINATNYVGSDYSCNNQSNCNKKYYGTEILNTGTRNLYSLGTRYNGQLSIIEFYLSYPFQNGYSATVTMNMATEDWRNHFMGVQTYCAYSSSSLGSYNMSRGSVSFVSQKKIRFTISPNENCSIVKIRLYSTNVYSTAFTGVSNWNLSSIYVNDSAYSSGGSSGGSSTPTPTPAPNNQDLINNQNQNTQSVINNQNQNTSDIIENNNSNTSALIEQNKNDLNVCFTNYFNVQRVAYYASSYSIVERVGTSIKVISQDNIHTDATSNKTLMTLAPDLDVGTSYKLSFTYNSSLDYIYLLGSNSVWRNGETRTITDDDLDSIVVFYAPKNSTRYYYDFMIQKSDGNVSSTFIPFGETCLNRLQSVENTLGLLNNLMGNNTSVISGVITGAQQGIISNQNQNTQATNQKLDDINNSINNSNVESGTGSDFFNDFNTSDNGGISGIITKPLVLINSLLSSNSNCNDLTFGIKFPNIDNKNVSLPSGCILWNNVPSNVVNIYQIFVVGFCSYYLLKRLFKDVEDLKNPDKDNVEVIDL